MYPDPRPDQAPTISVCIVTYERPLFLRRCVESLAQGAGNVDQVVIVDASVKRNNRHPVVDGVPTVYVHRPDLAGWMTRSRNAALEWVTGDVIAFLDDDVVVRPGWAEAIRSGFRTGDVAAAAGRTCNGMPGEEFYDNPIGSITAHGTLTDGFASNPGAVVEVTHGIGANMIFRREVLARLGGFRDDYPGTALREDTDIYLRVRKIGGRSVFLPNAVVDHRPAPHVKGARFDTRYKLYARRNHFVLLARNFGLNSPILRSWISHEFRGVGQASGIRRRFERLAVTALGMGWGLGAALRQARWYATPAVRTNDAGRQIALRLSASATESTRPRSSRQFHPAGLPTDH